MTLWKILPDLLHSNSGIMEETDRHTRNGNPQKNAFGGGLSSSVASAVGGVLPSIVFKTGLSKYDIFEVCSGRRTVGVRAYHADNVAPSCLVVWHWSRDNATLISKTVHPTYEVRCRHLSTRRDTDEGFHNIFVSDDWFQIHIKQSGNPSGICGIDNLDYDMIRKSLSDSIIEPQRHTWSHIYSSNKSLWSRTLVLVYRVPAHPCLFCVIAPHSWKASRKAKYENILIIRSERIIIYRASITRVPFVIN